MKITREEARHAPLVIYDRDGETTRVCRVILRAFRDQRGIQQGAVIRAALARHAEAEGVTYED